MKKNSKILIALVLVAAVLTAGCKKADSALSIGATPVPHVQLLELVRDDLAQQGIALRIVEFSDYVQPNMAVLSGDLDANFFQHLPYLVTNEDWAENLVSAFGVHVEPFGLYSNRFDSVDALPNGAVIAIPSDPTNGGRALLLLQANGLITLRAEAGITATPRDIVSNPRNFRFRELEAALLPRTLVDVDAATINGNFALDAGLNPLEDSLIIEGADSPYVNIIVVKKGNEGDARITALRDALLSDKVKDYIYRTYNGGVVAVF